ncbi:MAG: ORF6N domain-containing protein [bacterium]|nr:ORF6N domain-containing protein [bacterium]
MDLAIVEHDNIASKIYEIRGIKIMVDSDLAELYNVTTKHLKRQVKNNLDRFPKEFMFELTQEECVQILRYKKRTSSWGGARYTPYAFSEYGILALSSVMKSKIAVNINTAIIKIFVSLRRQIFNNSDFISLQEQVKRIETEQERLELNQRIDAKLLSDKMTKVSSEVRQMSKILDEFQNAHTILKKSDMLDDNMKELN